MDIDQKSLVGQNVTTSLPMYECMKRVLIGETKAKFCQQANLAGNHTVANFTAVMNKMSAHILTIYANCDQQ